MNLDFNKIDSITKIELRDAINAISEKAKTPLVQEESDFAYVITDEIAIYLTNLLKDLLDQDDGAKSIIKSYKAPAYAVDIDSLLVVVSASAISLFIGYRIGEYRGKKQAEKERNIMETGIIDIDDIDFVNNAEKAKEIILQKER